MRAAPSEKIEDFQDYRDFIAQRYRQLKQRDPKFSLEYCSRRLGTGRSYLKMIIDKNRHMSLNKLSALADLLDLSSFEQQFLAILVLVDTTTDERIKSMFHGFLSIMRARSLYEGDRDIDESHFDPENHAVFNSATMMAIESLSHIKGFNRDLKKIKSQLNPCLKADANMIETALKKLNTIGSDRDKMIDFSPIPSDLSSFEAHKMAYQIASNAVEDVTNHRPFSFTMMTLSLDLESINKLAKKLQEVKAYAKELSRQCQDPDQVLLLSNNFFAISKPIHSPQNTNL